MVTTESEGPQAETCPVSGEIKLGESSLSDPEIMARPLAFYRAMRKEQPVYFDPKLEMWLVSRYEDLQAVVKDPITFSVEKGYQEQYAKGFAGELQEILKRDGGGFFGDPIMTDPPYHTRIRKLMESAFTAHRVKELEPRIAVIVGELIESFADKGQIDGVNDFSVPMTVRVICEQLGLEQFNAKNIQRWSLAVTAQIGRMQTHEQMLKNAEDLCELQNYLIARIREREAEPKEDMISDLVHARTDDEENPTLSFEEVVPLVRALLIAGNETTATALTNLLLILATEPKIAQQLSEAVDDDRLLSRFVEELLRLEPPVRGLARMTTKEAVVGGTTLPAGAHMLLLFASANDDETVFPSPREFDLNRANIARQMAFSSGVHRCVGLSLARMELKVAAREIVRRLDNIKLAIAPEDIRYLPTIATHSIESLPITFTRRQ
ncbi:MAG: cytochrome P450 [Halioglobus sp.]|nr:cytochrome P450 [Halioglobus sp.]